MIPGKISPKTPIRPAANSCQLLPIGPAPDLYWHRLASIGSTRIRGFSGYVPYDYRYLQAYWQHWQHWLRYVLAKGRNHEEARAEDERDD